MVFSPQVHFFSYFHCTSSVPVFTVEYKEQKLSSALKAEVPFADIPGQQPSLLGTCASQLESVQLITGCLALCPVSLMLSPGFYLQLLTLCG